MRSKGPKLRARTEAVVEIAASPEVLWTAFTNEAAWRHWYVGLTELEWLTEQPWVPGAQFRYGFTLGFPLRQVILTATIREVRFGEGVAWDWRGAGIRGTHGYLFEPTPEGTRLTGQDLFYGRLVPLYRLLLLTRRWRQAQQAALEGFKAYIESGHL